MADGYNRGRSSQLSLPSAPKAWHSLRYASHFSREITAYLQNPSVACRGAGTRLLISYGLNISDLYRKAATYVDKILRGAKPANLPRCASVLVLPEPATGDN